MSFQETLQALQIEFSFELYTILSSVVLTEFWYVDFYCHCCSTTVWSRYEQSMLDKIKNSSVRSYCDAKVNNLLLKTFASNSKPAKFVWKYFLFVCLITDVSSSFSSRKTLQTHEKYKKLMCGFVWHSFQVI